jgi:Ser/Thr protein kinase RdoA (MazF antagonist)
MTDVESMPGPDLLREAGLSLAGGTIPVRVGRAWLADWRDSRGILRCQPAGDDAAERARLAAEAAWLHGFLRDLTGRGFPAPRPLPAFAGRSWTIARGQLWELVSWIPGREVGWQDEPPLAQIGALLARYHSTSAAIEVAAQRPCGVISLRAVPGVLLSARLDASSLGLSEAAAVRRLAAQLEADLDSARHMASQRLVIHGDFTCHNVVAAGTPARPVGVIDFQRAHVEVPLADIGYGLWRSGRPRQDADVLDLARVREFLRGYATVTPLTAEAAGFLPVYLYGRGLQMIARRILAHQPASGILPQIEWTVRNAAAVASTAADAAG